MKVLLAGNIYDFGFFELLLLREWLLVNNFFAFLGKIFDLIIYYLADKFYYVYAPKLSNFANEGLKCGKDE